MHDGEEERGRESQVEVKVSGGVYIAGTVYSGLWHCLGASVDGVGGFSRELLAEVDYVVVLLYQFPANGTKCGLGMIWHRGQQWYCPLIGPMVTL